MRNTMTIDRDLVERLRQQARFERRSMGEVIEQALRLYLGPLDDKLVEPDGIAWVLEAGARRSQHNQREEGGVMSMARRLVRSKATLSTVIDEDLLERLRDEARRRGVSLSALVERALEVYFLYDDISVEYMLRMIERYDMYRELGIMSSGATGCT